MRTVLLFPLALAAAAVGGCGPASLKADTAEQTAFRAPQRDLTLQQAETPGVDVASPVELMRAPVERSAAHRPQRARRRASISRAATAAPVVAVAPAPAASARVEAATVATNAVYEAPDPHALAPGQTVTMIPGSNGTSTGDGASGPKWTDARPGEAGRGSGTDIHPGGRGGGCGARGGGGHAGRSGGGFRGLR